MAERAKEQKTVVWGRWPIWNYQFAERDVFQILSITFLDPAGVERELDAAAYRLTIARNGVSNLAFKKHLLPKTIDGRRDAVRMEYEVEVPPDEPHEA
jgi:hypothetical protein